MDNVSSHEQAGSLRISTDVVEKIAKHAALEVKGVTLVVPTAAGAVGIFGKLAQPRIVLVKINNGVADIALSIKVAAGTKIPELSEMVQKNVKDAVQSMTSITVARVDVFVVGLSEEETA